MQGKWSPSKPGSPTRACVAQGCSPGTRARKHSQGGTYRREALAQLLFLVYNILVPSFHSSGMLMPSCEQTERSLTPGDSRKADPLSLEVTFPSQSSWRPRAQGAEKGPVSAARWMGEAGLEGRTAGLGILILPTVKSLILSCLSFLSCYTEILTMWHGACHGVSTEWILAI